MAHERRERLLAVERELTERYCGGLIDRRLDVIVEGEDPARPGYAIGTACRAASVSFPAYVPALLGKLAPVRAEAVVDGAILAAPWPEPLRPSSRPGPSPLPSRQFVAASRRISLPLV